MENSIMNTPQQIVEANIKTQVARAKMPLIKLIFLGVFAGMFIAGGAAASSVAMHAVSNVGLARTVAGCIFPVGLMMIVLVGGELFTGDCLIILGVLHKKVKVTQAVKVLVVVFLSNLVGAVLFTYLVYKSGQLNYTDGILGAFTIKVALGKVNITFAQAFCSAILCNVFVCAAVLMAMAAKDVAGKILAIFFPVLAFVVSGYEHCVANMYYIPAGLMAKSNSAYANKAMEVFGFTKEQLDALSLKSFFVDNLIPVTLGNIVGGAIVVGCVLYVIHGKAIKDSEK